jgi:hypothetical protein
LIARKIARFDYGTSNTEIFPLTGGGGAATRERRKDLLAKQAVVERGLGCSAHADIGTSNQARVTER